MPQFFPSLMAANQLRLEETIQLLDPHCAGFHLDLMDGHLVPNLALSPKAINAIDAISTHPSWVHLMAEDPLLWIERLAIKPQSLVSFQIEIKRSIADIAIAIKKKNWHSSLAIAPKTPPEKIIPLIDTNIDHLLFMTVEPGFSGQKFIPDVLKKVAFFLQYRTEHQRSFSIGIDGGIDTEALRLMTGFTIDQIAVASSIFSNDNPVVALQELEKKVWQKK